MTAQSPAPGGPASAADEAERWREAARLRREHPGWIVVWLARESRYNAYRRLPGTRRDTALTDPTADGLASQIVSAEQAARHAPRNPENPT
jgi:hypothetical protein